MKASDRIRIFLCYLFLPRSRRIVIAAWLLVCALVLTLLAYPLIVSPGQQPNANPDTKLRAVPGLESMLGRTSIERTYFLQLQFVRKPLPPDLPPPQGLEVPKGEVFAPRDEDRADFRSFNDQLRARLPDCSSQIAGTGGAAVTAMSESLEAIEQKAARERALFHYPDALLALCTGNPSTALVELEKARVAIDLYVARKGAQISVRDLQWVQQYRVVVSYAEGLARMANGEDAEIVDALFKKAIDAARSARSYTRGTFITLSVAQGDLFDFSTAHIVNARIYLWLTHNDAAKAWEASKALGGAPDDVVLYPSLAANFAVGAAVIGKLEIAEALFQQVRRRLEDQGPGAGWRDRGRIALARLTAVAATGTKSIYSEQDRMWWPQSSQPSGARKGYNNHADRSTEQWFPPIDVGDDEDTIDLWLWVRREREFLMNRQIREFHDDGAVIAQLGPEDRKFLEEWRTEITDVLGWSLLETAENIRLREGLGEARPLLELLADEGFPWAVRMQARLILDANRSAPAALAIDILWLGVVAFLFWLHFQLRAGYARTFTRRHHLQRMAR